MENFPQTYEPTGSQSILEQFAGLKNFMNNKLNSNEYLKTIEQTLTEEQKAQARENIGAGASTINVIDNLTNHSKIDALSANQGRVLNEKIVSSVMELQTDIDTNGGDIASLQGDVSELNQQIQRSLKTPLSTPTETLVVGIDDNGDQINLNVRNGLFVANNTIGVEHPVGSLYFCKHGSNSPASIFGGTWNKLADNVVIPLGSTAPLYNTNNYEVLRVYGYNGVQLTPWKPIGTGGDYESVYWPNGGTPSGTAQVITTDVKAVNLASSSNAINGIDVWEREA